jgi:hypothetical protein
MSFELPDFIHIVSTIDDFLSMSEPPCSINISNGYDEDEDGDENKAFLSLKFPLKNGRSEIKIYDTFAVFNYIESNGNIVDFTEFDDVNIAETNSSFKRSLKQIREFDRQQANIAKTTNTSIDRASFGLAEVK